MLRNININPPPLFEPDAKRKRRPAGTPDPDAEVVFLSPETLLESDKFVCEICNQGFQRDQNLQMHRRRHKVPWKLIKRETENPIPRKRVFVCPEPSCLHHDPRHALGDLVGIKKHFRRKHSNHKEWVCQKCSKGYAVQSDFKAHVKTCGTRGHSCDCGRVFSRVESFIEHQDACSFGWLRGTPAPPPLPEPLNAGANYCNYSFQAPNLELQLLTNGGSDFTAPPQFSGGRIFIGKYSTVGSSNTATSEDPTAAAAPAARIVKEQARELLQTAMTEKAAAEEARRQARQQIEVAEEEFSNARRIRRQAQAELEKAQALMKHYSSPSSTAARVITCHSCKHNFHAAAASAVQPAAVPVPPPWQQLIPPSSLEAKLGVNYISAALRDWEIRKR